MDTQWPNSIHYTIIKVIVDLRNRQQILIRNIGSMIKDISHSYRVERKRVRTQQKERTINLPELRRLATLTNDNKNGTKSSKKIERKKIGNYCERLSSKKIHDENYYCNVYFLKNAIKMSKKHSNNESISIKQIVSTSEVMTHHDSTNVVHFQADQYQGLRSRNQDRISVQVNMKIKGKIYSFFGIYDGHGSSSVSEYLRVNMAKIFARNLQCCDLEEMGIISILLKTFKEVEIKVNELHKSKSFKGGSCASVLIISQNRYYVAHLGDSRILKIELDDNNNPSVVQQITRDHNLTSEEQRKRIQICQGRIHRQKQTDENYRKPHRVYPGGLTVTRSLGDNTIKNEKNGRWLSSEPAVSSGDIDRKILFIMVTDGALQRFSNEEIGQYFQKNNCESINLKKSIQTFLMNSIIRQSNDNISILGLLTKPLWP